MFIQTHTHSSPWPWDDSTTGISYSMAELEALKHCTQVRHALLAVLYGHADTCWRTHCDDSGTSMCKRPRSDHIIRQPRLSFWTFRSSKFSVSKGLICEYDEWLTKWLVQQDAYNKMGLEETRQHYYSPACLAACQPPAACYLPSQEAGKIPSGLINMREILWKMEAVWRREVMAEGRNQACKDWHKQLSTWRGGRAMRVTATGNNKEIPGNFFSLYGCSSPPTKMLLLCEKIQEWQGEPPALEHCQSANWWSTLRQELDARTCSQIIPRHSSDVRVVQRWFPTGRTATMVWRLRLYERRVI